MRSEIEKKANNSKIFNIVLFLICLVALICYELFFLNEPYVEQPQQQAKPIQEAE